MTRVKIMVPVNLDVGDGFQEYQEGEEAEMGYETARDLEKQGYLRIIGMVSEAKTKVLNPPEGLNRKSVKV